MESYGEVIWSGTIEKRMHDSQVRVAPPIEEVNRNRPVRPAGYGHTKESAEVVDLRDRWTREKQQTWIIVQHSQQVAQPRKRGRDLPWGGPRLRPRPKAKPEPRLQQLALFLESQVSR